MKGIKMIIEKRQLIHNMLIKHFTEEGLVFIDKMNSNGGFYFFDDATALELKMKGYNVLRAPNGTKSTKRQPAWYIKE